MPHLVDYPFDDVDFHQQPVSPTSPYRRASAPSTALPSHAAPSSTKKVKSWWTTTGGTDRCPDEIPDIIDTSSSSRDYAVMGAAYEGDVGEGHRQQQYRYSLGASPPAMMAPPSRNESSSTINSIPGGHGCGARDHFDNSDFEDCDGKRQIHPDPYYRHLLPPPPIPSPSARSIRSKHPQRRSHRRSAVERRRSQKHQPFDDDDEEDLYHQQQFTRSSSSSSSGGAGTGGAASSHSHPSRASSRGGGRRSSSNSIASGGGGAHRHSYPGRRSATSSAARSKTDKDKLLISSSSSSSSKRGWWCLSSPRTLFRMLSFAGIMSVSLTVLANRNLLLVGDPNHPSSPLNANSVINWNSRDSFSLHYGNEHVSSSVSSSSSLSSSSSSLFFLYPAANGATAAATTTAAVAVAATTAAKAVSSAAATTARLESPTKSSSGLLRGKDKRSSVSTSPLKGASSATAAVRSSSTVRHLTKDTDSSAPGGAQLALLMPHSRSEREADPRLHLSGVVLPQGKLAERRFESQDRNLYTYHIPAPSAMNSTTNAVLVHEADRRVVTLHTSWKQHNAAAAQLGRGSSLTYPRRKLHLYPPDFTDPTQLYGVLDSGDERVKMMERRPPLVQGECVPMQEWQTTFHPSCNQLHESIDLARVGAKPQQSGSELDLFGTKGYWRNAWKVNMFGPHERMDTLVLKTLKIEHRFEEKVYEHNRIDAIAMERLTSSPHVINVFGFCGNSVVTEYADGKRLGELADKSKKEPLARLRIARDIAQGLADVHGIDGDGNATFVHLDINPANVVSIGGTLKLNDFNIGIIRRWNVTSNEPCGFPAQYPNPQWRSPEEARGQSNLTEKVDVFSMGHIFFRLICGHEPWNKLEPGGKPSKAEVNEKVERGVLPTIPKEIRHSKDPEEAAIRDAMLQCYVHDPAKRPSAREIARELQRVLDRLEAERPSVAVQPVE